MMRWLLASVVVAGLMLFTVGCAATGPTHDADRRPGAGEGWVGPGYSPGGE